MLIFVIVGMPAAGKNMARVYAESLDIPYVATGDIVRGEVIRRGWTGNSENTAIVSTELRGSDGLGVTKQALSHALKIGRDIVFLEGIRSWPEIELIRRQTPCVVVAFIAPRSTRGQRILSRGRADDASQAFDARDHREIAYGTAVPIALADEYILNTGSPHAALDALQRIVQKYAPSPTQSS